MPLVTSNGTFAAGTFTGTADATVTVTTRMVGQENINKTTKQISKSSSDMMANLLSSAKNVGTIVTSIIGVVKLLAGVVLSLGVAFLGLIILIQRFGLRLFTALERNVDKTSAYIKTIESLKAQFERLEGAVLSVFATLVSAAAPFITRIVDWLTNAIEKANMVLAALLGQKTVLKAIVKQTQDQEKAAKGTLAAFDQINVLQQDQAQAQDNSGLTFTEIPVDQKIQDFVTKFKEGFNGVWSFLTQLFSGFENTPIGKFFQWLLDRLADLAKWIATHPKEFGEFVGVLTLVGLAFLALIVVVGLVVAALVVLDAIATATGVIFAFLLSPIGLVIIIIVALIGILIGLGIILLGIITHWNELKEVATRVSDWIKLQWGIMVAYLGDQWSKVWQGIKDTVKNVVNGIIDIVNGMVRAVVNGVNSVIDALNSIQVDIPNWVPFVGGQHFGVSIPHAPVPQIPHLAEGAVIPPNAQFLALLGDQKNGNNIETPEALMRQIVQEEVAKSQQNINVTFEGSMGELIRVLQPHIKRETNRVGGSLITSGVTA